MKFEIIDRFPSMRPPRLCFLDAIFAKGSKTMPQRGVYSIVVLLFRDPNQGDIGLIPPTGLRRFAYGGLYGVDAIGD
ncbi:MAG: hypothetical protein AAFQ67_01115 [Pseudomonadota bacterium]